MNYKIKKVKSFTLMEILLGAFIFVIVAIMATAIISSVVNTRTKTNQQRTINMAAQRIFDEIGKTIKDGNPKKHIYICSHDYEGHVVPDAWGTENEPPNDFVSDIIDKVNPLDPFAFEFRIRNILAPFGEKIGSRRMGNVLQIVEFDADTDENSEVGWHPQARLPDNLNPDNGEYHIQKITQYSVEFTTRGSSTVDAEQGTQLTKYVIDNINNIDFATLSESDTSWWFPCRNLRTLTDYTIFNAQTINLLPENTKLRDLIPIPGEEDLHSRYFIVEGCDDLRPNSDNAPWERKAYPDFGGDPSIYPPLTCSNPTTLTGQSMYGPIIRVAIGLESGIEVGPRGTGYTRSVFRTTFQTRRVIGN